LILVPVPQDFKGGEARKGEPLFPFPPCGGALRRASGTLAGRRPDGFQQRLGWGGSERRGGFHGADAPLMVRETLLVAGDNISVSERLFEIHLTFGDRFLIRSR